MRELGPAFHDLGLVLGFLAIGPVLPALLLLVAGWRVGRAAGRARWLLLTAGMLRLASATCIGVLGSGIGWLADNVSHASSEAAESALVFILSNGGPVDAMWIALVAAAIFALPRAPS